MIGPRAVYRFPKRGPARWWPAAVAAALTLAALAFLAAALTVPADARKGCLPGYYPHLSGYSGLIVCRRLPYTGVW